MCHPFDKTFQFLGNNWGEVVDPPFPFVFSSWTFVVKVFQIMVGVLKEVINGVVLFVLHPIDTVDQNDLIQSTSGLSGRCPEVAGGISPWIRRRILARFHPLVFRECW